MGLLKLLAIVDRSLVALDRSRGNPRNQAGVEEKLGQAFGNLCHDSHFLCRAFLVLSQKHAADVDQLSHGILEQDICELFPFFLDVDSLDQLVNRVVFILN